MRGERDVRDVSGNPMVLVCILYFLCLNGFDFNFLLCTPTSVRDVMKFVQSTYVKILVPVPFSPLK